MAAELTVISLRLELDVARGRLRLLLLHQLLSILVNDSSLPLSVHDETSQFVTRQWRFRSFSYKFRTVEISRWFCDAIEGSNGGGPRTTSAPSGNHVQWYYPAGTYPTSFRHQPHQAVPFYGYTLKILHLFRILTLPIFIQFFSFSILN